VIKVGDQVRLLDVPPAVLAMPDEQDDMGTRAIFEQCVGHVFIVRGIETGETPAPVELWVHDGEDDQRERDGESMESHHIWVEEGFLEIVSAEPSTT
jgi:hypothetical protein